MMYIIYAVSALLVAGALFLSLAQKRTLKSQIKIPILSAFLVRR